MTLHLYMNFRYNKSFQFPMPACTKKFWVGLKGLWKYIIKTWHLSNNHKNNEAKSNWNLTIFFTCKGMNFLNFFFKLDTHQVALLRPPQFLQVPLGLLFPISLQRLIQCTPELYLQSFAWLCPGPLVLWRELYLCMLYLSSQTLLSKTD